jgi:PKD repeat protein
MNKALIAVGAIGVGVLALVLSKKSSAAGAGTPVPHFSWSPITGAHPLTINFYNASTGNITSESWSWGDGTPNTPATLAGPDPHTFAAAGTYKVTLTVANANGSAAVTATITVT